MIKKICLTLLSLILLAGLGMLGFIYYTGAWNLVFPSQRHETVPPELPELARPAVLLFTKTNGFRHRDGIAAGAVLVENIAELRGWGLYHTENGAVFNTRDLAGFDLVMFHNTSGDVFNAEQEQAFQSWLTAGGGWFGTHAAGDGSHSGWSWYVENLIGANFTAHILGPQFQVARVDNVNPGHPAMAALPASWEHKEEWYSWDRSPRIRGFTVLATIDEDTYSPVQNLLGESNDLRMGDHPVVWSRCVGTGRSIYSALGHATEAYDSPEHQALIEAAMVWALDEDACAANSP